MCSRARGKRLPVCVDNKTHPLIARQPRASALRIYPCRRRVTCIHLYRSAWSETERPQVGRRRRRRKKETNQTKPCTHKSNEWQPAARNVRRSACCARCKRTRAKHILSLRGNRCRCVVVIRTPSLARTHNNNITQITTHTHTDSRSLGVFVCCAAVGTCHSRP